MARVIVYRAVARFHSLRFAEDAVRKLLIDLEVGAKVRTAEGPYTTGELSRSIHKTGPFTAGNRVNGRVGSRLHYARIAHDGARAHRIVARVKGRRLRFYWRRVGAVVYPRGVKHPGQRGKHYLTNPLLFMGPRRGFRVEIFEL